MKITRLAGVTITAIGALCFAAAATAAPRASVHIHHAQAIPKTFIAVAPTQLSRLAVYSARTGRLIRYLTAEEPGGGVGGPQISPDGRTVLFARGDGTCAQTIDTVPVAGGAERVLIPRTGEGQQSTSPWTAAYSADGRYLIYTTSSCADLTRRTIHLRNLRTGHTVTEPGNFFTPLVFLNHDHEIVYWDTGRLVVVNLQTRRSQQHRAPRGCTFDAIAGTTTEFAATLQCAHDRLSVVVLSPTTFRVTRTLARFGGGCEDPINLSIAPADPAAALVQTMPECDVRRYPNWHILVVRDGHVTTLLSAPITTIPDGPVW
jgi:hypothetical protein